MHELPDLEEDGSSFVYLCVCDKSGHAALCTTLTQLNSARATRVPMRVTRVPGTLLGALGTLVGGLS